MKIEGPRANFIDESSIISELEALLKQPTMNELRPCQNCRVKCDCSGSTSCACRCSAECVNIPAALSIEPDRYPIEAGIAKLVFEFNSLRLFQTCWSCEGHLNHSGDVNKLPRIWFYAQSPTYTQLIVEYITQLMCAHRLQNQWGVQMISLNEEIYSTYSLEPALKHSTLLDIDTLRLDLQIISKDFANQIKTVARNHLHQLNQNQRASRFRNCQQGEVGVNHA